VNRSNSALNAPLSNAEQKDEYQKPATDKPAEPPRLNDEKAWEERVMRNMRRMAVDEDYRKEIAKNLS
jgi:hypothetical protein